MEMESKAFSWEIDNFSERNDVMVSDPFSSGGCEWSLRLHPKGNFADSHLALFLCAVNPGSLLPGWRRLASFGFVLLDQSGKELFRTAEASRLFCAENQDWGYQRMLPLSELQKEGFLENNKLTIEVYIKVVKVVHEGKPTETLMVDINGFHVLTTQGISVSKIFAQHPDLAVGIKSDISEVKTAYMNILLGLIETLGKPPQSLSETELRNADNDLSELTEAGFELDWLKSKLEEVSLEKKKEKKTVSDLKSAPAPAPRVYSFGSIDCFIKSVLILETFSLRHRHINQTWGRFAMLVLIITFLKQHPDFAVDIKPKSKAAKTAYMTILLDLVKTLDKPPESISETELTKGYSRLFVLIEVGFKLDWLKSKLDQVSLGKKKKENDDAARVQELEEKVKNLELMLSGLKVELDKEKAKSSTASPKVSFTSTESFGIRKIESLGIRKRRSD
ncbi:unnamed protein product [Thlaspi arvense]|uniref:MATH domain-containing protein n=1 Tax=Thlaspi arvense TaxID=13288 RepID=A0AAU9S6E0_THLAR|nr:unnamed protein product [Thlaspi arvense]